MSHKTENNKKEWDANFVGPIMITLFLFAYASTVQDGSFETGYGMFFLPIGLFWLGVFMGIYIGKNKRQ